MFEKEKLLTAVLPVRQRPPEKNIRHIVYAADQNYIRHIGTSMLSVLENNHFPIHFHLLVSGSESYDFSIFNHLETINPNYAVTVYHLNTEYFTTLQTNGYFTIAMYSRMCIPAILGDISDTTLYLDTDVLCLGDISELFTIDLTGQLVAAAPDTIFRAYINKLHIFGLQSTDPYFNSGVLLFNNKYWNESAVYNVLSAQIREVEYHHFALVCPDQDLLNLCCKGKIKWLPDSYNWIHWHHRAEELNDNPNNIRLVHFIGGTKPWHHLGFHPVYDSFYRKSPWYDGYLHQKPNIDLPFPNPHKRYKQAAKRLFKQGDKKQAWLYYRTYLLTKFLGRQKQPYLTEKPIY
jgi:hypothetical protein